MTLQPNLRAAVQDCIANAIATPGDTYVIYRNDDSAAIFTASTTDPATFAPVTATVHARPLLYIVYKVQDEERSFEICEPRANLIAPLSPVDAENFISAFPL